MYQLIEYPILSIKRANSVLKIPAKNHPPIIAPKVLAKHKKKFFLLPVTPKSKKRTKKVSGTYLI